MSDDVTTVEDGKYVYCIIKSPKGRDFGQIGIGEGSSPVYTVHFGDWRPSSVTPRSVSTTLLARTFSPMSS